MKPIRIEQAQEEDQDRAPLCRQDLDMIVDIAGGKTEKCERCNVTHKQLKMKNNCHPRENFRVLYEEGVLFMVCAKCENLHAAIAVAESGIEETTPMVHGVN